MATDLSKIPDLDIHFFGDEPFTASGGMAPRGLYQFTFTDFEYRGPRTGKNKGDNTKKRLYWTCKLANGADIFDNLEISPMFDPKHKDARVVARRVGQRLVCAGMTKEQAVEKLKGAKKLPSIVKALDGKTGWLFFEPRASRDKNNPNKIYSECKYLSAKEVEDFNNKKLIFDEPDLGGGRDDDDSEVEDGDTKTGSKGDDDDLGMATAPGAGPSLAGSGKSNSAGAGGAVDDLIT